MEFKHLRRHCPVLKVSDFFERAGCKYMIPPVFPFPSSDTLPFSLQMLASGSVFSSTADTQKVVDY